MLELRRCICPRFLSSLEVSDFGFGLAPYSVPAYALEVELLRASRLCPLRPFFIVLDTPCIDFILRIVERREPVLVHALLSHEGAERFDVGIVRSLSRTAEVQRDLVGVGSEVHGSRGELGAIVQANLTGLTSRRDDRVDNSRYVFTLEAVATSMTKHFRIKSSTTVSSRNFA